MNAQERGEFEAQIAANKAVMEWIDADSSRKLIGCTPAMVAQLAVDAYRKRIRQGVVLADGEPARGIDLEIVEVCHDEQELAACDKDGLIVPGVIRINGQDVLSPKDHPARIHEMEFPFNGAAMVTLTVWARSIKVGAELKR